MEFSVLEISAGWYLVRYVCVQFRKFSQVKFLQRRRIYAATQCSMIKAASELVAKKGISGEGKLTYIHANGPIISLSPLLQMKRF